MRPLLAWINKFELYLFLGTIVTLLLFLPIAQEHPVGRFLCYVGFSLIFVAGSVVCWQYRFWTFLGIATATVAISGDWLDLTIQVTPIQVVAGVGNMLFFLITAGRLMHLTVARHIDQSDAVLGTICVYLLVGLAWSSAYAVVVSLDPDSFTTSDALQPLRHQERLMPIPSMLIYYSFVTMSTLGFGDITPVSPFAQTLTWMQAVTGQFFIAILVARFVALTPSSWRTATDN